MECFVYDKREVLNIIINIGHLAGSASLKMSTINKIYSGLTIQCVEMPNASYTRPLPARDK